MVFCEFLQRHSFLLNEALILQYYSNQALYRDLNSRIEWQLPDKKPLPSLVSLSTREASPLSINPLPKSGGSRKGKGRSKSKGRGRRKGKGKGKGKSQGKRGASVEESGEVCARTTFEEDLQFVASLSQDSAVPLPHGHMVRLILTVLRERGRREGVPFLLDCIKRLQGSGFHFTIAYFWIQIIDFSRHSIQGRGEGTTSATGTEETASKVPRKTTAKATSKTREISSKTTSRERMDISGLGNGTELESSGDESDGDRSSFFALCRHCPHLTNPSHFLQYYSAGLIFNTERAQTEMVLPDLKPLPSLMLSDTEKKANKGKNGKWW